MSLAAKSMQLLVRKAQCFILVELTRRLSRVECQASEVGTQGSLDDLGIRGRFDTESITRLCEQIGIDVDARQRMRGHRDKHT